MQVFLIIFYLFFNASSCIAFSLSDREEIYSFSFQNQIMEVQKVDVTDIKKLQIFLENFEDFFILCEGVRPSAKNVLSACPTFKDPNKDKICLAVSMQDLFVGFIDLISNYPSDNVLTVGYLLIHPSYQSLGLGTAVVDWLLNWTKKQGFITLRLAVQKQNSRALGFWKKNKFTITKTLEETLGEKINLTDVLERPL